MKLGAPADSQAALRRLAGLLSSGQAGLDVTSSQDAPETLLQGLASEGLDLALLTGPPTPAARAALEALPTLSVRLAGVNPVALVANPSNRTGRLALVDLRSIFRGQATRWPQVAGDDLPLVPYTLDPPGAVARLLDRAVLGGAPIHPRVRRVPDVATALESVRRTPGGIALVPRSQLPRHKPRAARLKLLALAALRTSAGARPTDAAALAEGTYPLLLPVVVLARRGEDPRARRLAARLRSLPDGALSKALGLPPPPPSQRSALRRAWIPNSR